MGLNSRAEPEPGSSFVFWAELGINSALLYKGPQKRLFPPKSWDPSVFQGKGLELEL